MYDKYVMLDVGMCAYHMLIFLAQAFVIKLDTSHR